MGNKREKAVVLFSGGQDSTTVLYAAIRNHGAENVYPITFYYGQRHGVEVQSAFDIVSLAGCRTIELIETNVLEYVCRSALLDHSSEIAANHAYDSGLPASFVPNRNAFFLTVAHAYAQKIEAATLYTGVCETDYSGYPDCREEFILSLEHALNLGAARGVKIVTPLMYLDKAQTFLLAEKLNCLDKVIELSQTCYEGDTKRNKWGRGCGKCPACVIRQAGYDKYRDSEVAKNG